VVQARRYCLTGGLHCLRMRASLCYELTSSAERNKQTARGRSAQCTNNSDPITSTSELLLRQNSVTAHADLRLTTAQQRSIAQNLQSNLYATRPGRFTPAEKGTPDLHFVGDRTSVDIHEPLHAILNSNLQFSVS
jgi:hypothetical protein